VALLAVAVGVPVLHPSPRERFRRELAGKAERLDEALRKRSLLDDSGIVEVRRADPPGGSARGVVEALQLTGPLRDDRVINAATALERHFQLVAPDVLLDLAQASPAAFEAWKRNVKEDVARYQEAARRRVARLAQLKGESVRWGLSERSGRVCFPEEDRCLFVEEVFGPTDLDGWANWVRQSWKERQPGEGQEKP
jgi:hypothetical protein